MDNATKIQHRLALVARAQARLQKSTVNIKATFNFGAGGQKTMMLNECYFEDVPLSIGGRSEYGQISLSGSCSLITTI